MAIEFTVDHDHTSIGDEGEEQLIGDISFTVQTRPGDFQLRIQSGPSPRAINLPRRTAYLGPDGHLYKDSTSGEPFRLPANDPIYNLEHITYRADFTLTTLLGDPVVVRHCYFPAPSTDTTLYLTKVMTDPEQPVMEVRTKGYVEDILDLAPGRGAVLNGTAAEARAALGLDLTDLDEWEWYANVAAFPATGVTDVVYGARDTGRFYRWSGSAYVDISPGAAVDAGAFPWPPGLVGLFDFKQDSGNTLVSRMGSQPITLTAMGSKTVVKDAADPGPFGPSLVLDGATLFFKSGGIGALDVSALGDEVTVVTWVKDTANNHDDSGSGTSFRAGSHNDGGPPSRQYGSYFDAGGFIGHHGHYNPHIGAQDGASPGYPFNHDYAATHRKLFTPTGQGQWHMEAFTFNGSEITAYIDGMTDSWLAVPEPDPAYFSLTPPSYTDGVLSSVPQILDRNPYQLHKGINRSQTTKIFTIGGSPVQTPPTTGINFTTGKLGGVAVFNRALTATEIMKIRLATLLSGEAITSFGFEMSSTGPHYLNEIGWSAGGGAANVHVGNLNSNGPEFSVNRPVSGQKSYLTKTSSTIGAAWGPVSGLNSAQIARIRFKLMSAATTSAPVRLLVKVGGQWYASNTTYSASGAHAGDTDWSGAELKTHAINWGIGNWKPVTILDTGGVATYQNLVKNPILSTGATGLFTGSAAAHATSARVSDGAGGFVWRTTWTGTDNGSVGFAGISFGSIAAITAANVYSASMMMKPSKPQALNLEILWVNAGGSVISTIEGGVAFVGAGQQGTLAVAGTAPALTTQMTLRAQSVYPPAVGWNNGDTCDIGKMLVVAGPLLPAAFSGDSALAAWDGTAGASTSTITNVPTGTLSLSGSTNAAWIDNALITAVGFLSSGGDGTAVRVTDLELLPS